MPILWYFFKLSFGQFVPILNSNFGRYFMKQFKRLHLFQIFGHFFPFQPISFEFWLISIRFPSILSNILVYFGSIIF